MDGASPGTNLTTDHEDNAPVSSPPDSAASEAIPVESTPAEPAPEILPHRVVEAILFASDSPLPPQKIAQVMGVGTARDVRRHIETLNREYAAWRLAFRVDEIAGGFQLLTLPAYNTWLTKLLRARQETKLSQAALETLAIVAYKQPCTRADIEAIRGVAAGDLLQRLREINLVKIVGRAEDLGRPLLYGTTKRFLEVFGLPALEDLPQVEALSGGASPPPSPPPAREGEAPAEPCGPGLQPVPGAPVSPDSSTTEEPTPDSLALHVSPATASPAEVAVPTDDSSPAATPAPPEIDPARLADAYAAAQSNAAADHDTAGPDSPPADDRPRLTLVPADNGFDGDEENPAHPPTEPGRHGPARP